MKIASPGLQAGLSAQRQLWQLVKAQRQASQERQAGQAFVAQQLAGLLLGRDLTPEQQLEVVRKLSATSDLARRVLHDLSVPDGNQARIPRHNLVIRTGGVAWRPFPMTYRPVPVAPLQKRLQNRMALALQTHQATRSTAPRVCVLTVGFQVDCGGGLSLQGGADRVELSSWGLESLALEGQILKPPTLPRPRVLVQTLTPELRELSNPEISI